MATNEYRDIALAQDSDPENVNRRTLLRLLLASPLLTWLPGQGLAQSSVEPRLDIRTFSTNATKVEQLRKAVETLQTRPFTDASSWYNMAGIHEINESEPDVQKVPPAIRALWHQCHRDESLFFLWHRAYVWSMEKLMQAAIGDMKFRLPYWDWYADPSLPAIFRDEFIDPAKKVKNPLYVANRNNGVNSGARIWNPAIVTDFSEDSFFDFQNSLNRSEHGTIHMAIGRGRMNMGHPTTAARDPIFWLHHANIDRLLPVWVKTSASHKAPDTFVGWDPKIYRFPKPGGGLETPTIQQLALNSAGAIDYSYENTDAPKLARPPVPARPNAITASQGKLGLMANGITSLSAKKSIKIGAGGTVDLPVASANRDKIRLMASGDKSSGITAMAIVMEGVSAAEIPQGLLSYRVFLNLPSAADTGKTKFENHYLGSIDLFSLGGHEHGAKPSRIRFPVLKVLANQLKGFGFTPNQLSVSLVPVLAPEASPPATAVLTIGEMRVEASNLPTK
jgi:tyrosinase